MALVLKDRVKEQSTTTGTGTLTLSGAFDGYQSFSAIGNGNTTYYTIYDPATGDWEVGIGTYTASGTTLSRDTVLASSNAGGLVPFTTGTKEVFCTYPAEKGVWLDSLDNIVQNDYVDLSVTGTATINAATLTTGTVSTTPANSTDIANKQYVDTLVASGITYHTPVKYEVPDTTGNLNATYNNGTGGVGATLTNAGTQTAFTPDGIVASIGDRILIYNQTNAAQNGVYTVTTVGSGSTNWVLTRSTDTNSYGLKSPTALGEGDAFFVTSGNTGAGETYVCNTVGTINFGTTAITFTQVSSEQIYSAGTGLNLTNTTFSLADTGTAGTYGSASQVPVLTTNAQGQVTSVTNTSIGISASQVTSGTLDVVRGGTGLSSYAVGDIVYASGTGTLAGLADAATGNVLLSGGTNTAPAYGKVGLTTHVSGTLPIANGGTGQTTAQAAINSLAGAVTSGQYLRGNGTNVVMSAIQAADVPTLNQNTTGSAGSVANALTMNNSGTGAASGTTFNGSVAQTISYNTIGASPLAGSSSLTTTGTVTSGTWSASFGSVSGANLTNLTAGNLAGTIPSAVLGNSTAYVGTTAVALNRASANQGLTGITSIAMPGGTSGTITITPAATAGTTALTIPANSGSFVTTGDTGTVTNTMLAGSIANAKLANSSVTINGSAVSLGGSVTVTATATNALTISSPLSGTSYNGSSAVSIGLSSGYGDTQNPYASKTANYFLAAPNGAAGVPTFRAIVAADIPTLNQNTTGSAGSVAGLVANSYTTYGNTATTTAKGGYYGLLLGSSSTQLNVMGDASGNGGFYQESVGTWPLYWNASNACLGIAGSTTSASYKLYVNGAAYASGAITSGGVVTGTSFSGAGTGLTGTASSLSIGGSAASVVGTTATAVQSAYQAAINTATPGLSTYGVHFNGQTTADYASGITWNGGTTTTNANAGIYVQGSGSYGTKMYFATTDSYAIGSKTAISIDHTGLTNFVRVRPTALGNTMLDAGNYNSYAPTLTGTGASGTWSINVTGSAGSATTAGTVTTAAQPNITSVGTLTSLTTSGPLYRSAAGAGYLNGQYSSVENVSTSGAIYSIGGSYVPGTTTLGNMYGIGYTYSGGAAGNPGGVPSSVWGMYVASGGTARIWLDSDNGRGYFAGNLYVNGGTQVVYNSGTWSINISGSAASATSATYASYLNNAYAYTNGSDGWFRSTGTAGWYNATYAVGIYSTAADIVRTYNGSSFVSEGTVTAEKPFFVNPTTVAANYTVPANYNAHSAGPITINTGVTVTVSTGSTWVVV